MGPVPPNTGMLLWGSLAYALVVLVLIFPWRTRRLCDRMGPAVWDPKQSWASTVTAIGAVLATVLSARPELPFKTDIVELGTVGALLGTLLSTWPELPFKPKVGKIKTEFLGLSIFFGALILIAPLI